MGGKTKGRAARARRENEGEEVRGSATYKKLKRINPQGVKQDTESVWGMAEQLAL